MVFPTNSTVLEGEKVVFQCNKSGIPTPTVTWSRIGGTLPDTAVISESGLLKIESVSFNDQGVYLCTATNSEGSATAKARLKVTGMYYKFVYIYLKKGCLVNAECISSIWWPKA